MARMEEMEMAAHRRQLIADVNRLVDKYRAIFDWDVPDIDQAAADKLIIEEMRKALNELEREFLK
jgi:hypothetical protein